MSAKNKGAAANGHPHMNKIFQDVVYHQEVDDVKSDSDISSEMSFREKAKALYDDLRKYRSPCEFTVRINHLCEKHGVTKQVLTSLRKEVLEELKNGEDRRASLLIENTEPFEEAIDMKTALDLIYGTLKRHIVADENLLVRATLWVAHTYFADQLFISPIALITAPQSNCGKSLLMTVMMDMCYRTFPASASMSESAMFRIIENACPTIGLDEADLNLHNRPEMQAIVNAGHMRSTAWVFRVDVNTNDVLKFSTFCPKIITGIRSAQIKDTLTNRSIVLSMRRKKVTDKVEAYQRTKMQSLCAVIRRKMRRAALDAIDSGEFDIEQDFDWPEWLDDGRARDNWTPLLAIAKIASSDWYRRAILASYEGTDDNVDLDKQLLLDLNEILNDTEDEYISVSEMVQKLIELNSDWLYVNGGLPVNTRWLGLRLSSYGLQSVRIRMDGHQVRVYVKRRMLEAFANYISIDKGLPESLLQDDSQVSSLIEQKDDIKRDLDFVDDLLQALANENEISITAQICVEKLLQKSECWKVANGGVPINKRWICAKLSERGLRLKRFRKDGKQFWAYDNQILKSALKAWQQELEFQKINIPVLPVTFEQQRDEDGVTWVEDKTTDK